MKTKTVEIDGISIAVPVGSMDPPTKECELIMKAHADPRGWKYPVRPAMFHAKADAEDYAYCLDWFLGGHEIREVDRGAHGKVWLVGSKGYYHYVGA